MAQITQFNLGKNIRVAPSLLSLGEGVIFTNINNNSNTIKPVNDSLAELQNFGSNSSFYFFKGHWISKNYNANFTEFQEKLYYSDALGIPQKTSDGINFFNLGIATPVGTITTIYNGTIDPLNTMVRQYCYTYYNIVDGTESAPSSYSAEVSYTTNNITISGIVPSTDPQVTNIKLYRLGGAYTTMVLVATIAANTTSYIDMLSDILIDGEVLSSSNGGQAPAGLNYMVEHNSMFFGALNDKLYFSDIAYVNNWSPFFFLDFDRTILGIGSTQNGLLVFTEDKTYIITGTTPTTLSKMLLHGNQGCLNHKTIKYVDNVLIWLSNDGLCASNGGNVQIYTLDKLGKLNYTAISAEVWDNQYFLFHSTGTLVMDFRFGQPIYKDLGLIVTGSWYSGVYDKLYYTLVTGALYSLFMGSSYLPYTYKTGKLTEGAITIVKNYKVFYIYIYGTSQLKLYIDGTLSLTKNLVNGLNEVKLPQGDRLGYYVEFEFSGTGEIVEIEYKVEGRQNGR